MGLRIRIETLSDLPSLDLQTCTDRIRNWNPTRYNIITNRRCEMLDTLLLPVRVRRKRRPAQEDQMTQRERNYCH